MVNAADPTGQLALDVQGVDRLKLLAKTDPDRALRGAAQQFEAVFLNMLLKSMRDATPQDSPFDSDQTRLYTGMLDQQFAQALSKRGIGLADVMVRQLTRQAGAAPVGSTPAAANSAAQPATETAPAASSAAEIIPSAALAATPGADTAAAGGGIYARARDFVNRLWPQAAQASRVTGIPAHFILGQAALESGWGRAEIRSSDGTPSYNLFNVKAGRGWNGQVVAAATTEYVNGVAQKSVERFRAYGSYAEAFVDYARLLKSQPRYAAVIENGRDAAGFARGLQQAGYATDPLYADKLLRIINGSVLRQGLIG